MVPFESVTLSFGILILSLFFLVKASDYFIFFSKNIGVRFKWSPLLIGIILISFGTSIPELVTSILAVIRDTSEIVIGNIFGSNIANSLLVLGVIGLFSKNIFFRNHFTSQDILFLIISSALLLIITLFTGLSVIGSVFLLFFLVVYLYIKQSNSKKEILKNTNENIPSEKTFSLSLSFIGFFIMAGVIYFSSEYVISSTISIGLHFSIPYEILAASVIAFGTSLPEVFVSISAIKKKHIDLAIGNIIGSNIFNILGVLSISSFFGGIIFSLASLGILVSFFIFSTICLLVILKKKSIGRLEGIFFTGMYLIFLLLLF